MTSYITKINMTRRRQRPIHRFIKSKPSLNMKIKWMHFLAFTHQEMARMEVLSTHTIQSQNLVALAHFATSHRNRKMAEEGTQYRHTKTSTESPSTQAAQSRSQPQNQ